MNAPYSEQRESKRHQIEVPVHFERGTGISRNISFTGIYFTTGEKLEAGETLKLAFELKYSIPGKSLHLDCTGQIVRVDSLGNHFGIAARLEEITYLH